MVFAYQYCEIFKNIFFYRTRLVAASLKHKKNFKFISWENEKSTFTKTKHGLVVEPVCFLL